jgi:two-component system chemotaxis response regulator CheB
MPSIDVLFFSAAKIFRNRTMGILLTGMGSDGVNGLGAIKRVGGKTIAEAEETCILYAMPKFAAEKGFADFILPNYEMKEKITSFVRSK